VITSQPNKIKQLQQPEDAYDSQGQLEQQAHGVIGCMEGSMALLWITGG
jgi:hypothetical protein